MTGGDPPQGWGSSLVPEGGISGIFAAKHQKIRPKVDSPQKWVKLPPTPGSPLGVSGVVPASPEQGCTGMRGGPTPLRFPSALKLQRKTLNSKPTPRKHRKARLIGGVGPPQHGVGWGGPTPPPLNTHRFCPPPGWWVRLPQALLYSSAPKSKIISTLYVIYHNR